VIVVGIGIKQGHALTNQTLCARQADAALVRQEFTNCPDAAATEMVDIVGHSITRTEANEVFHRQRQNPP
jgi:phosphoribosylaminoimidazole (AIR) synthetase